MLIRRSHLVVDARKRAPCLHVPQRNLLKQGHGAARQARALRENGGNPLGGKFCLLLETFSLENSKAPKRHPLDNACSALLLLAELVRPLFLLQVHHCLSPLHFGCAVKRLSNLLSTPTSLQRHCCAVLVGCLLDVTLLLRYCLALQRHFDQHARAALAVRLLHHHDGGLQLSVAMIRRKLGDQNAIMLATVQHQLIHGPLPTAVLVRTATGLAALSVDAGAPLRCRPRQPRRGALPATALPAQIEEELLNFIELLASILVGWRSESLVHVDIQLP